MTAAQLQLSPLCMLIAKVHNNLKKSDKSHTIQQIQHLPFEQT